jgi:hypothetical protein
VREIFGGHKKNENQTKIYLLDRITRPRLRAGWTVKEGGL